MGILDSLFVGKNSSGTSQPKSGVFGAEDIDWQPDAAHLLFLSKFLIGQELQNMTKPYWEAPIREPPMTAIDRFINRGWLVPATLTAKVDRRFKVGDVRSLLKERGLRASGRKDELIERLATADEAGMTALVADMKVYECSFEARAARNDTNCHSRATRKNRRSCAQSTACRGFPQRQPDSSNLRDRTSLLA